MNVPCVELDHIFLFVKSRQQAEVMMREAGLTVNYGRPHPGQGTSNLCACLDDVFLELLWLDGSEISDASRHITLEARGRGEALPLGIAWRGDCHLKTISYDAPFLPDGKDISVVEASLNPALPFVFQSPGDLPPISRTDGLAGTRQMPHYSTLKCCRIGLADHRETAELLRGFDKIEVFESDENSVEFSLCGPNGEVARTIVWAFSDSSI